MMPDTAPTHDAPTTASPMAGDDPGEIRRLKSDLARMRMYAQALEERCNRLWSYVPDTHGTQDPVLPFVALHCHSMSLGEDRDQATV